MRTGSLVLFGLVLAGGFTLGAHEGYKQALEGKPLIDGLLAYWLATIFGLGIVALFSLMWKGR